MLHSCCLVQQAYLHLGVHGLALRLGCSCCSPDGCLCTCMDALLVGRQPGLQRGRLLLNSLLLLLQLHALLLLLLLLLRLQVILRATMACVGWQGCLLLVSCSGLQRLLSCKAGLGCNSKLLLLLFLYLPGVCWLS